MQACVQQPDLAGLLAALAAARSRAGEGPAAGAASWPARLSGLTPVERRQLRAFLLQVRWFGPTASATAVAAAAGAGALATAGTLSPDQLQLLRSLPIYEVYPSPSSPASTTTTASATAAAAPAASSPSATAGPTSASASATTALFTALDPARHRLAPADTDPRVLGPAFVRFDSGEEEGLLAGRLGLPRLGAAALLVQHVGPQVGGRAGVQGCVSCSGVCMCVCVWTWLQWVWS